MLTEAAKNVMQEPSTWSSAPLVAHDEHGIDTPEQVALHLPLAGLGSRFLALLLDTIIQFGANIVLILIIVLVFSAGMKAGPAKPLSGAAEKWFVAGIILFYFLLFWGYFTLFEAFRNGQTPGKRALKIRVIKGSGRQITFFEALARNLLRVVDSLPGMYLVGVIAILLTRENKRLGDLVADTIVIHERVDEFGGYVAVPVSRSFSSGLYPTPAAPAPELSGIPADRVALLHADDLLLIENYLARAISLPIETRGMLASRLLDALCGRMQVPVPTAISPERTLEALAFTLRSQGRR